MTNLTVLDFNSKNIRFERRGDRVWVSLTDMAKATGKQVGHWNALGGTIEYLSKFESIIGIPIMLSNTGGTPETTGTWAIEEVAIKFAMWCNVEFEIWVTQQIKTLMKEGSVSIIGFPITENLVIGNPITGKELALTPEKLDLLRYALSSVPKPLVDGFILNCVQARHPELKPEINAAHSLLAANIPIPEILLTPTAIGERLGPSARTVNLLLTDNGYQVKNPNPAKGEPKYFPTEKGKEYSMNTIATGRKEDNTSYQHTKWNESMIDIIQNLM